MAYVEMENYFFSNITGRKYLSLFSNPDFDTDTWQALFHLPLDKLVNTYSTGMKKKLAIVGALKLDKDILILNEAFNGQDIESNQILKLVLQRLCEQGKTIIVTSHVVEIMLDVCNYIHYLTAGAIYKTYPVNDFIELKIEILSAIEKNASDMLNKAFL
ncbi:MAG: hypothetical protein LBL90_13950 [Prevotellaceae bacterium]|jgi:ABC-2 type transport system ATP-binding protein|nr:hypothetical protein [Prevotellaceae bacterium]